MAPTRVALAAQLVVLLSHSVAGAGTARRLLLRLGGQREAARRAREVPGWGDPTWGGRSFSDSLANYNPWGKTRPAPVVGDLDPIAPMDRVDGASMGSNLKAVALAPTDEAGETYESGIRDDWVAPHSYPKTFPGDYEGDAPDDPDTPLVPLSDKHLIAHMDALRPSYAWRSSGNYPLVAPADRIISSRRKALGWLAGRSEMDPWAVSDEDQVGKRFSKYFDQFHEREQRREAAIHLNNAFAPADKDGDGTVSREEYDLLLKAGQNKTGEEVERLWGKFHMSRMPGMSKVEFGRLLRAGFNVGAIARDDISTVLRLPGAPLTGFWGSGARCPPGTYVTGARLKVMPLAKGRDNTGLNCVGFRCSDGTEASTVQGADGTWTAWALCPAGQRVYSARARSQPFSPGADNTALVGLELGCRAPDLSTFSRLHFGDALWSPRPDVAVGLGPSVRGGGWTKELLCSAGAAVCGAQAHVIRGQGAGDDLGVADLRVYCCSAAVDCTAACHGPQGAGAVGCQVCHKAAGMK